jgi:phosphoribosylanthranilate isomerase/hypoxanthine phosphoribosyltransferase
MAQKLVLGHDPNNLSRADYLAYIGALDYIKSGRLTLFHALTYRERRSTVKPSDQYLATRVTLLNDIRTAVRTYYGACIGRHKAVEYNGQEKDAEVRSGLLESQIPNRHWRSPELDHPLTIMANAYIITKDQDHRSRMVDTIVGLPSGGTEVAFAVQYAYGIKNDQEPEPEVLLVPLSAHSGKSEFNEGDHDEVVDSVIKNNLLHIVGKNILVPEDNSNTGNTAQVIHKELMQYGANDVHVTLAAIDPTRISIKQHRWKKTTDTVPHPDLGDDAVTVVPITRAEDTIFSDDRQILKLERLRRLRKEAVKTAPQIEMPNISETDNKQLETIVKVCGVHNSVDMRRAYSAGVRWFGVHLTYDKPDEYKKKVAKMKQPTASLDVAKAKLFYTDHDLPIPWAEFRSLKHMVKDADSLSDMVNLVLLLRPETGAQAVRLLNALLPPNFTKDITVQVQSTYDSALVDDIRQSLNTSGYGHVKLIQTIGANKSEALEQVQLINKDPNVDYLLVDSDLSGGTGKVSPVDVLQPIAEATQKPWFLAGGISSDNVLDRLRLLSDASCRPVGFDLESSVESPEASQTGILKGTNIFAKVRKDEGKLKTLVKAVSQADIDVSYEKNARIDIENTPFYNILRLAWKQAKEECGYFNIHAIATHFCHIAKSTGLVRANDDRQVIGDFVRSAITYPYVPFKTRTFVQKDQYDADLTTSWMRLGARDLLSACAQSKSPVTVLTAGDAVGHDHAGYIGSPEQRLRFELSGLAGVVQDINANNPGNEIQFVPHPFKLTFFNEQILPSLKGQGKVIFIDDNPINLIDARQQARAHGLPIRTLCIGEGVENGIEYCQTLEQATRLIATENAIGHIVCDMDDVLLHEGFRKYHQPRNVLTHFIKKGYIQ